MLREIWAYTISHRWLWPPLLLAGAFLSSILHNVFSGIFKTDEPVVCRHNCVRL